jgi:hypothetical protein
MCGILSLRVWLMICKCGSAGAKDVRAAPRRSPQKKMFALRVARLRVASLRVRESECRQAVI